MCSDCEAYRLKKHELTKYIMCVSVCVRACMCDVRVYVKWPADKRFIDSIYK